MKIVHPKYFDVISMADSIPETLVIENPLYFRETISALIQQTETDIGDFVLSDKNGDLLSLNKKCLLLTDIYHFYENDKRMKSKIQHIIVNEAQYNNKQFQLLSELNEFAINLANSVQYSVSFKEDLTIFDIVKMFDFDVSFEYLEFWEKLIEYLKMSFDLLEYKLAITVNLKDSITVNEYTQFTKDINNNKICLLMIEHNTHPGCDDPEHLHIVDEDLCIL